MTLYFVHGRQPIFISYARCETTASIANVKRNTLLEYLSLALFLIIRSRSRCVRLIVEAESSGPRFWSQLQNNTMQSNDNRIQRITIQLQNSSISLSFFLFYYAFVRGLFPVIRTKRILVEIRLDDRITIGAIRYFNSYVDGTARRLSNPRVYPCKKIARGLTNAIQSRRSRPRRCVIA